MFIYILLFGNELHWSVILKWRRSNQVYVCALNLNEMILFHLEPLNDDPRPVSSCFLEPTGEYNFYSFSWTMHASRFESTIMEWRYLKACTSCSCPCPSQNDAAATSHIYGTDEIYMWWQGLIKCERYTNNALPCYAHASYNRRVHACCMQQSE